MLTNKLTELGFKSITTLSKNSKFFFPNVQKIENSSKIIVIIMIIIALYKYIKIKKTFFN